MSLVEPLRLFHPTAEKAAGLLVEPLRLFHEWPGFISVKVPELTRAVVTRDAERFTIVAGGPARMIGGRA